MTLGFPPDDRAGQLIEAYYAQVRSRPKNVDANSTQVYTPIEVAEFMARSVVELLKSNFPEKWDACKLEDPCCGAGVMLLFQLRQYCDMTGKSKREVVENHVFGKDIDLGAVLCTNRVLQLEAGGPCRTNLTWGDTFAGFEKDWRQYEDCYDFDLIEKLNAELMDEVRAESEAAVESRRIRGYKPKWPKQGRLQ